MAFSDFLSQVGVDLGSDAGGINFDFVANIIIFLILAVIAALVTWYIIDKKSYNKTIVKFREVNGITKRLGTEKAREIILPGTSVRAFYLKSSKFYIPRPSIESAQEEFWFFIRKDGEWINVGLTNINKELTKLGLHFDHTDMRMANAALKKLIDTSYKKGNWIKEWAPYLGFGAIIIMLGVSGYLVMNESAKITSAAAANVEILREITVAMKDILTSANNIAAGNIGSGVTQVVT